MRPSLLLAFALLAACDKPKPPVEPPPAPKGPAEAPAGGIPQMRTMYEGYLKDVERYEKLRAAKQEVPLDQLRGTARGLRNLVSAAAMAVAGDTKQEIRRTHALLVKKYGDFLGDADQLAVEIDELARMLEGIDRGTTQVPPGHTVSELQSKQADLLEKRREMTKQAEEMRAELQKLEIAIAEMIRTGKAPEGEDSLLRRELQSYRVLLERTEKLLP